MIASYSTSLEKMSMSPKYMTVNGHRTVKRLTLLLDGMCQGRCVTQTTCG